MKTKLLLTIGILFFAILAKSQAIVRPPINTESIYLTNFIWENDSIMKDSLYYIRFDNDRCFSIKGLYAGDEWEQLCAPNDSIYIDSLDIMICNNCYIVTDTTNFFVKRSSCNYNCWTYSFDGVTWLPWFCLPEIEPETKLYIFAKDSNLLNVYHRVYYNDSDSIGYKNNSRYIDKWLYYGVDSIYWRQSPDSLFMDGVWYNLPDTLPINVDSLIYVNNVPISIGDTIFTHDSIYYNGVWVQNDTIHIVDNSITNERDSIYISNHLAWYGNRDTLNINDADYNPLNEKDSIQINGTWLSNGESLIIDTSKWVNDTYGIHSKNNDNNVGIGVNSDDNYKLKVNGGILNNAGPITSSTTISNAIYAYGGGSGYSAIKAIGISLHAIEASTANLQYVGKFTGGIGSLFSIQNASRYAITAKGYDDVLGGDGYAAYFSSNSIPTVLIENKATSTSTEAILKITSEGNRDYIHTDSLFKVDKSGGITSTALTVGDSTVTTIRSGATFTIWQGTQAAYDAIGTKDGKTIYYIEQNFNVLQILFFLLMFFGSRGVFGQSNWAAVNIGTTEMKKIYVGDKLVWEKESHEETDDSIYICGEWYPKVTIGTQIWLAANLHCDDGGGGIYSYNNDTGISDIYGYLYTWAAAIRMSNNIEGWHLPSLSDVSTLSTYLGGSSVAGGKLKETGYEYWNSPNTGATNESVFTALGAGLYFLPGSYYDNINILANFWESTTYYSQYCTNCARIYTLNNYSSTLNNDAAYDKLYRLSIRLIKD